MKNSDFKKKSKLEYKKIIKLVARQKNWRGDFLPLETVLTRQYAFRNCSQEGF
jgi:hypothetical protein